MEETSKIRNYRPASILKYMEDVFTIAFRLILETRLIKLNFTSAYKKSYSSNHVLLRLIENWKKSRDNKNFWMLFFWISPRLLTVLLMIYLLKIRVVNLKLAFKE